MKTVYKFRVLVDHKDDIFRDILVPADEKFLYLHNAIQDAFEFDNSQMAAFYMSNENWDKGQEITLMDMADASQHDTLLMENVVISDMLRDKGDKMLYVFDFFLMWIFYIDLVSIHQMPEKQQLPEITTSYGNAPKQYDKEPDLNFGADQNLNESFSDDFEFENDDEDEDEFGRFNEEEY